MATKNYLDYMGLKRVLKRLLPGARKIWHGTAEEWHDLSETERDKYDQAEVINDIGSSFATNYVQNQLILSDWEDITISTNVASPTIMQYDGYISIPKLNNSSSVITINGITIMESLAGASLNVSVSLLCPVKKGDAVKVNSNGPTNDGLTSKARFYKLRDYTGR